MPLDNIVSKCISLLKKKCIYALKNQVAISIKFTISQLNRYFISRSFVEETIKILLNRINENGIRFFSLRYFERRSTFDLGIPMILLRDRFIKLSRCATHNFETVLQLLNNESRTDQRERESERKDRGEMKVTNCRMRN